MNKSHGNKRTNLSTTTTRRGTKMTNTCVEVSRDLVVTSHQVLVA